MDAKQVESILVDYTHGAYEGICLYSEAVHSDHSRWTCKECYGEGAERAAFRARLIADSEKHGADAQAEAIHGLVMASHGEPRTLIRTETQFGSRDRFYEKLGFMSPYPDPGAAPEVGSRLRFGIKSASKRPDFAELVAQARMPGMAKLANEVAASGGEVLTYRIADATRYLDISALSGYEDQCEVLFAGDYEVVGVTTDYVTAKTGKTLEILPTLREYANDCGFALEFFTSKRGEEMVRAGTHVYPVRYLDEPVRIRDAVRLVPETAEVPVIYVDLRQL